MINPIVKDLDFLRQKSEEIPPDADISNLLKDMEDTMRYHDALGIAAVQIGTPLRVFIVDSYACDPRNGNGIVVFKNPKISVPDIFNWEWIEEGCLSLPDTRIVRRYKQIMVNDYTYSDVMAIAIQHEYDHLEGTLLIDRPTQPRKTFNF